MWLVLSISFTCIPISVSIFTFFQSITVFSLHIYLNLWPYCVRCCRQGLFGLSLLMGRRILSVLMVNFMAVIMLIVPLLTVYLGSYSIARALRCSRAIDAMLVQIIFGGRARCRRLLSFMRLYLCSFCDYYMQISLLTYSVLSFFYFIANMSMLLSQSSDKRRQLIWGTSAH